MKKAQENTVWVNYLRSFLTVLVVFHHSNLSYTTFANFDMERYINSTHVVVDNHRWIGLDILVSFNDIYFMALMFLIAGLFLIKSIKRKGQRQFLSDRFKRLFIPFIILGTFLMLISYAPAYYLSKGDFNLSEYLLDFFRVQSWPVGPPWFIWVLFVFNVVFALSYNAVSGLYQGIGDWINNYAYKPLKLVMCLIVTTAILYIPMTHKLTVDSWFSFGPFDMQLNRLFLYFGYFLIGVVVGGADFNNKLLSSKSSIVTKKKLWLSLAILIFIVLAIIPEYLIDLVEHNKIEEFYGWMIYYLIYVMFISFICLAMITTFRDNVKTESSIWNSLSDNAYMIYLCHFPFVVWIQFLLLEFELHAILKMTVTFFVSLILSWVTSLTLRKLRFIRRHI